MADGAAVAPLAVDVEGLTWRPYGRGTPVLDGLDLHVPAGQHVLLVGPSGSGKSTLLRAVAGVLETADAGERAGRVLVGGSETPDPGSVGLVLQDPGAGVVAATVARDVAFGLENRRVPRGEMAPVVETALDAVGLAELADAPTSTLSGGQSQRLALAGALVLQPGVLLLDEPLAMLDPETRAEVVDVVARAAARLTLVVVEHRLDPWLPHVERLVVMDERGAIVADGDPRSVLRQERDRLLDLGVWVPGEPDPEPVVADPFEHRAGTLSAEGVAVDRVARPANRPPRVVRAVEDVDLDVPPGATHALVGPSGSGKSSLLLALAGLDRPAAGAVRVDGRDPAAIAPAQVPQVVGWVPQSPSAGLVERTVTAELLAGPRSAGLPEDLAQARAGALLGLLGMEGLGEVPTVRLSGGEQRRLAVAAAVMAQPRLLLTDEMTIGQDRHTWAAVVGLAESLARGGSAVVHATHDPALVRRCAAVHRLPARPVAPPLAARRPLAAHAGPLSLLAACFVALGASLAVGSTRSGLAGLAVEALLGAVSLLAPGDRRLAAPTGRVRTLAWRLLPMLVGALVVGWSTWLLGGHSLGLSVRAAVKMLVAVVPSAVLLPFVDPDRLGDHLAQRLHLPPRVVVSVGAALQRLQDVAELRTTLERARRMRGLPGGTRAFAAVVLGVLVEVLASASRLAVAMDARGFARATRRTWAAAAPWRRADSLVLLLGLLPLATVLVVRTLA